MEKNDRTSKHEKEKGFGDSSDEDEYQKQQPEMDVFDEPFQKRPKLGGNAYHSLQNNQENQRSNPYNLQPLNPPPSLFSTSSPFNQNLLPPPRNPLEFFTSDPTSSHQILSTPTQQSYLPTYTPIQELMNPISSPSPVWTRQPPSKTPTMTFSNTISSYTSGKFVLLEQPNGRQKRNDSKLMQPDPFIICLSDAAEEERSQIISGHVSVSLVNKDGSALDEGPVLSSPYGLHQNLNDQLVAKFSLKISGPSFGSTLALKFQVFYFTETTSAQESIISRPFIIYSDRKMRKGTVEVTGIKPEKGLLNQPTEVWIKGRLFSDMVGVTFGGVPAAVVEISPNLLTVLAPARPDLQDGSVVKVVVTNTDPDSSSSSQPVDFVYRANIRTYAPASLFSRSSKT